MSFFLFIGTRGNDPVRYQYFLSDASCQSTIYSIMSVCFRCNILLVWRGIFCFGSYV